MNNYIEVDEVFEAYGKNYITLEVLELNGKHYILVDELRRGDIPLSKLDVFEDVEKGIKPIKDEQLKMELIERFKDLLNKDITIVNEKIAGGNLYE